MSIGKNLRKYRELAGLSQIDASAATKIAQTHISNYENDRRKPGLMILTKFANAYNCSVSELLGETEIIYQEIKDNSGTYRLDETKEIYNILKRLDKNQIEAVKKCLLHMSRKNYREMINLFLQVLPKNQFKYLVSKVIEEIEH